MRYRIAALTVGFAVIVAACTSANGTPATAPPVPDTLPTTTTSAPATTTVTPRTTTTLDRLTEIQAIFEDLEHRRLQAIYDQDEEAFRSLYANDAYLLLDLEAFKAVKVTNPNGLTISIAKIEKDGRKCLAAVVIIDASSAFEGGTAYQTNIVLEDLESGWGYSWVGEEWTCDGPHPLSG